MFREDDEPAEVKGMSIHLDYKFWDPKVDGDVPGRARVRVQTVNAVNEGICPDHLVIKTMFPSSKRAHHDRSIVDKQCI